MVTLPTPTVPMLVVAARMAPETVPGAVTVATPEAKNVPIKLQFAPAFKLEVLNRTSLPVPPLTFMVVPLPQVIAPLTRMTTGPLLLMVTLIVPGPAVVMLLKSYVPLLRLRVPPALSVRLP